MTRYFFEQNLPVASVCHGVEIPARAGCVKGRRMATVAKCKFDLEVCGGIYVNEPCVVDGNLVSGRTFHDNGSYLGPWIQTLKAEREKRQAAQMRLSSGAIARTLDAWRRSLPRWPFTAPRSRRWSRATSG